MNYKKYNARLILGTCAFSALFIRIFLDSGGLLCWAAYMVLGFMALCCLKGAL